MIISLTESTHTYWVDLEDGKGKFKVTHSVTGILKAEGFIDYSRVPKSTLISKAKFGTAGHAAMKLFDQDDLDFDTLDPRLARELEGWKLFKEKTGWVNVHIEQPIYSHRLGVAGQPDRIGYCTRGVKFTLLNKLTALEIKFVYALQKAFALQLAGYKVIYNDSVKFKDQIKRRLAVNLKSGDFEIETYDDPADETVFLGAVNNYFWKLNHNIGGENGAD